MYFHFNLVTVTVKGSMMIMKVKVVIDVINYPSCCLALLVLVHTVLELLKPGRTCVHIQ